jgi:hypothetical protein
MAKIVVINDGIVETVGPWDGSPFENPPGRRVVMVDDSHQVQPGWLFNPGTNTLIATVPTVGPHRVNKVDFMRLFTLPERIRFNAFKKQVMGLTPTDYVSTEPSKQLLVALEVLFEQLDAVSIIELNHAETVEGIGLLAMSGILGDSETAATRMSEILAGQLPDGSLAPSA